MEGMVPFRKLKALNFLEFLFLGAFVPVFPLFMRNYLGFSGSQIGLILSMTAIANIAAPFWSSFLADRKISAELFYSLCLLTASALIFRLYSLTAFLPVLLMYLAYQIVVSPTIGLTNSITLHHLGPERNQFGKVRVWGTIGWFVIGWIMSFLWLRDFSGNPLPHRLPDVLIISSLISLAAGIFAFTIPRHKKDPDKKISFVPREAFQVVIKKEVVIIFLITFLVSMADRFYIFGVSLFIKENGVREDWLLPVLSAAQTLEILTLGSIGFFLGRWNYRKTFFIGIGFKVLSYFLLAFGHFLPLIILGMALQGTAYTFFFGGTVLYLDHFCDSESRSGVQQLYSIVNMGISSLVGNNLAGWVYDFFIAQGDLGTFQIFWSVPLTIALAAGTAHLLFFRNPAQKSI